METQPPPRALAGRLHHAPLADAVALQLLGGRDGHGFRRPARTQSPVLHSGAPGSRFHLLRTPARRAIAFRIFGNLLPVAICPADGLGPVSHRASGRTADSSRRRLVRGFRVPFHARHQRSGCRCPALRARNLPGRVQPFIPDPMAGCSALVGRRPIYPFGRLGVACSSAVLAVLHRAVCLCANTFAPS